MIARQIQPNGQPVTIVGSEPEPVDDWKDFTERWIAERRRKRKPVSSNTLVLALEKAGYGKTWAQRFNIAWRLLYVANTDLALEDAAPAQ